MTDKIDALIHTLLDPTARDDERDDAAMDLGRFSDDRALTVLLQVASNPDEDRMILDSCGESIAEILLKKDECKKEMLDSLAPIAKEAARSFLKIAKPEWVR
jgi:hypothetical protein